MGEVLSFSLERSSLSLPSRFFVKCSCLQKKGRRYRDVDRDIHLLTLAGVRGDLMLATKLLDWKADVVITFDVTINNINVVRLVGSIKFMLCHSRDQ